MPSEEFKDLKAQEYAIKILSNAIYGYYAYPKSRWYSTICAKSVASWGRFYIKKTIEELEKKKRASYAGSVGYFSYTGNMDMAITIRTILFKKNKIYIQAGAGIVADSVPEYEEKETRSKAKALIKALELAL
ncbi:MAG: chorismate-binding protein [Elusimicrobia bacterium]|nr:chorismate-binding protein [Elusimicrobiota bacterium]